MFFFLFGTAPREGMGDAASGLSWYSLAAAFASFVTCVATVGLTIVNSVPKSGSARSNNQEGLGVAVHKWAITGLGVLLVSVAACPCSAQDRVPAPGKSYRDCPECPEMISIPPGDFVMGSPPSERDRVEDEGPQHLVHIHYAFSVSKFPITRAEWKLFVRETGRKDESDCLLPLLLGPPKGTHPVVCVSWEDAQAYVSWLSRKSNKNYRLLTEAEYEYAARAGTKTTYYWGSEIDHAYWQSDHSVIMPVGSFAPNRWGLYDMTTDLWSFTQDCYHASYNGAPVDGSAWKGGPNCTQFVMRGGTYGYYPNLIRSAARFSGDATGTSSDDGLRVAKTP